MPISHLPTEYSFYHYTLSFFPTTSHFTPTTPPFLTNPTLNSTVTYAFFFLCLFSFYPVTKCIIHDCE